MELGLADKRNVIWNLDESSFSKDPSKTKIVDLKGHAAMRVIATPRGDNTTDNTRVLLEHRRIASAIGGKKPPLSLQRKIHMWEEWTYPDAFPGTVKRGDFEIRGDIDDYSKFMVLLIFIFGMERNNFYFYCVGKTDSSAMFSENVEVRGLL